MRRAFALVLLSGLAGMVTMRGAYADQTPDAGHYDSRMRYVAYNPGQVVHLSTIVGATMVVSFAPDETVTSVAETDSLHLAAVPKGNYLFLKPSAALKLQPIIVLTQRRDGSLRRYVFEIETVTAPTTADGAKGVFYSVQFTYPADAAKAAAARAAAEARKVAALNRLALQRATQTAAQAAFQNEQSNPYAGPRNYKYVGQGDHSLAPLAVWDNGYSTVLQFAGNARIPSIFVIEPDGQEATASYAVNGDIVQLDQTAREWRLRDGGTVLNIYNLGYQSVGGNPETGTTSPDVSRVVVPLRDSHI
ncbi:TrbG/VirB9 family P-type conjugative transfer protein [Acidiphilium sp. AL]|uniref:TrbG/VirB9 family P-type conjugative transfer protein n=1 Tax=Acidiphilium sp. AL TaxID=2871704 RepID=UPI0021CB811B|nr:TrbG/VirB9 family P-type conjugative transfer protein [Acidiphilium sp. AL]MCU4162295.1 TrbG/VirB9 family P-type conjugative transfer protein [Acidiphilium sp. AL]